MLKNKYPYSNIHEINLDWIIEQMTSLGNQMDNFTLLNTIKIADPIAWDITSVYDRLTIVSHQETEGYVAYISAKDVPAGIAISNTDYWVRMATVIDAGDLSDLRQEMVDEINRVYLLTQEENNTLYRTLEEDIATAYDNAIDAINNLSFPIVNHNRMTYYIDASGGDDSNDGLTQATAFKTFDRFMQQAEIYSALHGRIVSAGNYVYSYNEIANIDLDIQATVSGVVLTLTSNPTDNRFTFYNGRINIYGAYGVSVPMELRLDTDGIIYMVGCTSAIHDLNLFNQLRVYGGEIWLENVGVYKLYSRNSFVRMSAGSVRNNDTDASAIRLLNCTACFLSGITVESLSEQAASGISLLSAIGGVLTLIGEAFNITAQSNYDHGIELAYGVMVANTSQRTMFNTYSVNGNSIGSETITN